MNEERCPSCGGQVVGGSATSTLVCARCLVRLGRTATLRHVSGESLLDYLRTVNIIGEGPRGRVFLAEWTSPGGGLAALKCASARAVATDRRLESLDHPSIASVHEIGANAKVGSYVITDYVPGVPITRSGDRQALSTAEYLELWLQAADAVAYAHAQGLLHLNLKPTNVLASGRIVKILDFEGALPGPADRMRSAYRAPEQTSTGTADPRSDIFALGVLLGDLLSGRSDTGVLDDVVSQATRPDPSERQLSVAALVAAARTYLTV